MKKILLTLLLCLNFTYLNAAPIHDLANLFPKKSKKILTDWENNRKIQLPRVTLSKEFWERLEDLKDEVEYLYLAHNPSCSSIDFSNFPNLKHLSFINNRLEKITLSNLPELTYLNLAINELQEINLSELLNLEKLILSNNNISKIDLSPLTELQELDLWGNNLTDINLMKNSNLQKVSLSFNCFEEIPPVPEGCEITCNHQKCPSSTDDFGEMFTKIVFE